MHKRKIRILHVLHGLPIGGAELLVVHYIRALGTKEYDHFVFSFGQDGPVRKILEGMGVSVHRANDRDTIRHPIRFFCELSLLIYNLIKCVNINDIDLIQSHTGHSNELAMLVGKLCRVPTFPTIHSTKAFLGIKSRFRLGTALLKTIDHLLLRKADRIIAISDEISNLLQRHYAISSEKILVIKNGICIDGELETIPKCIKDLSLSSEALRLIAVGRLVPLKAFDILIKAISNLKKMGVNNLLLRIVGDGPELDRLRFLVSDFGLKDNIEFIGSILNVLPLMIASDIFVIPSRYEGLSLAMIEAMACGRPIIASNGPGLRDHIQHKKTGLLFPVDDDVALAKAISLLANDTNLRSKLSIQSKNEFEQHYNMKKNIALLENLIRKYCHT